MGIRYGGRSKGVKNVQYSDSTKLAKMAEKAIKTKERVKLLGALARGVKVLKTDKDGNEIIYKEKPDLKAIQELNDRQYGKPRQTSEVKVVDESTKINVVMIPSQTWTKPEKK
jgi:hypothetical protein